MSTPELAVGPCDVWITKDDILEWSSGIGADDPENLKHFTEAAEAASWLMWELSGRLYNGICERKVRPCRDACGCWGVAPSSGVVAIWQWAYGEWMGGWRWVEECGDTCGCGSVSSVRLAGYPVVEVTEVKINGAVIPPTDYRLDRHRDLVYLDDTSVTPPRKRAWPSCQNVALDDTQSGTFSVTYKWGQPPPLLGKAAAAEMAGELLKVMSERDSRLPERVTQVVRSGITMTRLEASAIALRVGNTGLTLVDAFLAGANPDAIRRRPAVWSPDLPRFARKVGT